MSRAASVSRGFNDMKRCAALRKRRVNGVASIESNCFPTGGSAKEGGAHISMGNGFTARRVPRGRFVESAGRVRHQRLLLWRRQ
jgi:hypothetical protein